MKTPLDPRIDALSRFVDGADRLVVLTGAGCSTESGIPDYRALDGTWKRKEPMRINEFRRSAASRQRYWARSFVGWPLMGDAKPNRAHDALAALESRGAVEHLITQNVDSLHQAAGSERVVDLHGQVSWVICLECGDRTPREHMQARLSDANPDWSVLAYGAAPDGDADIDSRDTTTFEIVHCAKCGGDLKPDVVFFGENVPRDRVEFALDQVERADALLVAGSSLMVWSGFRFAKLAAERGTPVAIVNIGKTRADELATLKIEAKCGEVLSSLVA